jgi:molybdenum cofactor cytidylyltransferase
MSAASDSRRIGVILAAGRGGRMGGKKQLTPWTTATGTIPLVAAAYDAIRSICDEMVVVLGHDADAVATALGDRPFHRAESDPHAPMFESIRAGLLVAQRISAEAAVVMQPGDHPEVATSTLETLNNWSLKCPIQSIIPEYGDRGGHPIIIPPNIAALLVEAECPAGLGQFWIDHPDLCRRVPIDDPKVVRDIDTPADLV